MSGPRDKEGDGPGWRTLLWASWTAGWIFAEVGHGPPATRGSLAGAVAWLVVTVVMLATRAQESYMRSAYDLKEKDK